MTSTAMFSPEIPSASISPDLHELVLHHNIHECSEGRCLENGQCIRKFPKDFSDETVFADRSYPIYRRRNNISVVRDGRTITNTYL